MADAPTPKPPFWSSLPGIFTALGGVIVALTGLITALYSAGAIGSKANSNTASNAVAVVSNSTAAAPAQPSAEGERYRSLTGKWEVTEKPSQYYNKVDEVTWRYEATVSGNVLTLTGKITAIDGDKNLPDDAERLRVTYVTTLIGSNGIGEYKLKRPDGSAVTSEATIRFTDDFTQFNGKFEVSEDTYTLTGRKL